LLIDVIGTSFCEVAIDEERSDVSGWMDDKSGMATCYPEYFVTAGVCVDNRKVSSISDLEPTFIFTTKETYMAIMRWFLMPVVYQRLTPARYHKSLQF
jgi:hypothetical protein